MQGQYRISAVRRDHLQVTDGVSNADLVAKARSRDVAYYASHALHALYTHSRGNVRGVTAAR